MSERPPDTGAGGLAQAVWGQILDLAMQHRRRFFQVLADFGFTFGDFRALAVMEPDQPMPMGSLAQVWECDASNATWVVDRLEERGLVERRTLPTDRRVKTVALTDVGLNTKKDLFAALYRPPDEFLALDTQRLEALHAALGSLPPWMLSGGSHRIPAGLKVDGENAGCAGMPASLRPF